MPRRRQPVPLKWPTRTELLGLTLTLQSQTTVPLDPHYTTGLHAWFLDQVRQSHPDLSAYLHDGQTEKPFTLSRLEPIAPQPPQTYTWTITALSQPVCQWLTTWLKSPPTLISIRGASFTILDWQLSLPPTTYRQLATPETDTSPLPIQFSFLTPTSFRHRGHFLSLPVPMNLFHSYLRRWLDFCGDGEDSIDRQDFLDWVDEFVIILKHKLESQTVMAGKQGAMTGFTGAIELTVTAKGLPDTDYVQFLMALCRYAPYCGTGHKTPFGLGQTRMGWLHVPEPLLVTREAVLAQRIADLTELFTAHRKRTGGDRAQKIAVTWATIQARREQGESLTTIAADLDLKYETARTYSKLAKRVIATHEQSLSPSDRS